MTLKKVGETFDSESHAGTKGKQEKQENEKPGPPNTLQTTYRLQIRRLSKGEEREKEREG